MTTQSNNEVLHILSLNNHQHSAVTTRSTLNIINWNA